MEDTLDTHHTTRRLYESISAGDSSGGRFSPHHFVEHEENPGFEQREHRGRN
jgi:hypothetical protein